ncbi:hypothetical protein RDI58_029098 [Solanum bulbocastanum]|uniref:Uncharacterized protein n=1 Tax=Solanum bulbocastanum TaxID=147425 RepID=A0AAN8XZM2_SOLBU
MCSFLNCCSGNTHDDMLLAKLETILVLVTLVLQCLFSTWIRDFLCGQSG